MTFGRMGPMVILVSFVVTLSCLVGNSRCDPCPGESSTCSTGMTCCLLPRGQQGCCPYVNATCCTDRVHCCPMGSECDSRAGGHCHSTVAGFGVADHKRLKFNNSTNQNNVTKVEIHVTNERCSDDTQCPDESTCCPMADGSFGCCPLEGAVCCADKLHCCPGGTVCDLAGYCHQVGYNLLPLKSLTKTKALPKVSTDCPSEESKCPQGNTCCLASPGDWGCCPMDHAVCCADMQHCCPQGYVCQSSGSCAKEEDNLIS